MTLIDLDTTPTRAPPSRPHDGLGLSGPGARPRPDRGDHAAADPTRVADSDALIDALADRLPTHGDVGVLLGGDTASAILAALLPPDTPCYSVSFDAPGAIDTTRIAAEHAIHWGHPHLALRVGWSDHLAHATTLMARKDAPLHPMEVSLYLAAQVAAADGVTSLVVGTGAGSIFGDAPALLGCDWTFDEFVARYPQLDPADYLTDPVDISPCFERYRVGDEVDVVRFLREVQATGSAAAHRNALSAAGVTMIAPYTELAPAGPLDLRRIRDGEPASMLADAHRLIFDEDEVPLRPAGPDPMDVWLDGWAGPTPRPGLRDDILGTIAATPGSAKWRLWSLAAHLDLVDRSPSLPLLTIDTDGFD